MTTRNPHDGDLAAIIIGFTREIASLASNVGELTGQVRELIHQRNNDAIKIESAHLRLDALEKVNVRRDGATGVIEMILKSPLVGWLVGAVVSAWAILTGRVNL